MRVVTSCAQPGLTDEDPGLGLAGRNGGEEVVSTRDRPESNSPQETDLDSLPPVALVAVGDAVVAAAGMT